jgi:hypothetical protein
LVATHGFRPLILNGYQPLLSRSFTSQVQEKPKTGISKFIQQSKELVTFYKDGLKLLWTNKKEAAALQLKVKEQGYLLNRPEFQLVHRSKKDMLKLIPFGLVFLILPESVSI